MKEMQDLFISHASEDKAEYIFPLVNALSERGVTYWLDTIEISWGERVVGKINEGLGTSRRLLLCLSRNFLERRWALAEMESAFAQQLDSGSSRVLPLILNSRDEVLATYPLLRSLTFRVFDQGVESIADELAALFIPDGAGKNGVRIRIQSAHSGLLCDVMESVDVSVEWLASKASAALGGKERADAGAFKLFPVRWILVDVEAEDHWNKLSELRRRKIWALVKVKDEVRTATAGTTSLKELGLQDGVVFHLYGVALGDIVLWNKPMVDPNGPLIV